MNKYNKTILKGINTIANYVERTQTPPSDYILANKTAIKAIEEDLNNITSIEEMRTKWVRIIEHYEPITTIFDYFHSAIIDTYSQALHFSIHPIEYINKIINQYEYKGE